MGQFIEDYLKAPQRACLYASQLAYGHEEKKTLLRGEFYRHGFEVEDSRYQYVPRLSNDHMAVFLLKREKRSRTNTFIIAFRGTDGSNPQRFIGLPPEQFLTERQRNVLGADERTELIAKFCPREAAVGCGTGKFSTLPTTYGAESLPSTSRIQQALDLGGGNVVIDRASDCQADALIVTGSEASSRLHQFQAQSFETICDAIFSRSSSAQVFVTGHSLGGSLAAFAAANYVHTHPTIRNSNQLFVVLFSAGSGKTGSLGSASQSGMQLLNTCKNTTGILNDERDQILDTRLETAEAVLRASSQVHPPSLPRTWFSDYKTPSWWTGIPIAMFRETCDVVSSSATGWWPTKSFRLSGSLAPYNAKCLVNSTYHGLAMYMSDKTSLKLQGTMTWTLLSDGRTSPSYQPEKSRYIIGETITGLVK